jgi:hypothetical protein
MRKATRRRDRSTCRAIALSAMTSHCAASAVFGGLVLLMSAAASEGQEAGSGRDSSGHHPAEPDRRLDLRLQYQAIDDGLSGWVLTPRLEMPFDLGEGWRLNTRFDLPIISKDIPDASRATGLGDVLTQALFVKSSGRYEVFFGGRVILPTATQPHLGSGKLRLLPTIGAFYHPDFLPPGSYFGGLVRYDVDVAGPDGRDHISALTVNPELHIALPDRWSLTFSPELEFDLMDGGAVSLPFDVTVGKKITDTMVMSLQFKHKLIEEAPINDWSLEARIGFFF